MNPDPSQNVNPTKTMLAAGHAQFRYAILEHLVESGLAFDVLLRPFDYLFLIVFFGFLVIH